jgi:hypothetical protein
LVDRNFNVRAKGAAYYALQLLTQHWVIPGDNPHGVYRAITSLGDRDAAVTAYALRRPDGTWSVLIINKDTQTRRVAIDFGLRAAHFTGTVNGVTFGSAQYKWRGLGASDLPSPATGLKHLRFAGGATTYVIAPQSLTVLWGRIETPE